MRRDTSERTGSEKRAREEQEIYLENGRVCQFLKSLRVIWGRGGGDAVPCIRERPVIRRHVGFSLGDVRFCDVAAYRVTCVW